MRPRVSTPTWYARVFVPTQRVADASRLPPSKSTSSPGGNDGGGEAESCTVARARAAVARIGQAHTKTIVRVATNEIISSRAQGTEAARRVGTVGAVVQCASTFFLPKTAL